MSFARGVALFNQHEFWLAHEAWEEIWLTATGDDKLFLQGLIQLAAAYHHIKRGTHRGAVRLIDAALEKLSRISEGYRGLDRAVAEGAARRHKEALLRAAPIDSREFPELILLSTKEGMDSSRDGW